MPLEVGACTDKLLDEDIAAAFGVDLALSSSIPRDDIGLWEQRGKFIHRDLEPGSQ